MSGGKFDRSAAAQQKLHLPYIVRTLYLLVGHHSRYTSARLLSVYPFPSKRGEGWGRISRKPGIFKKTRKFGTTRFPAKTLVIGIKLKMSKLLQENVLVLTSPTRPGDCACVAIANDFLSIVRPV